MSPGVRFLTEPIPKVERLTARPDRPSPDLRLPEVRAFDVPTINSRLARMAERATADEALRRRS